MQWALPGTRLHDTDGQFGHKSVPPTQSSSWTSWFLGLLEEIMLKVRRPVFHSDNYMYRAQGYAPNVAPVCPCSLWFSILSDSDINVLISCKSTHKQSCYSPAGKRITMFYNSSDIVGMLVKKCNSFANLKTATHGKVSGPRGGRDPWSNQYLKEYLKEVVFLWSKAGAEVQ